VTSVFKIIVKIREFYEIIFKIRIKFVKIRFIA